MEWLKYNWWTLIVAASIPFLAIVAELSGVFKDRSHEFLALFIVLATILLATDYFMKGTYNSASFMFLLSIIFVLIYILTMKLIVPSGEHFIVPIIIGFIFSALFFDQGLSSITGVFWLGGCGIIMVGGFAALGHWKDRSVPYAIVGMALSLLAVLVSFMLTIGSLGY